MGRRRKLNIGRRTLEDSNQHIQASGSEGTQFVPSHTTSTHAQGSHFEDVHESADSHSIPLDLEAEEVQIEKGLNYI